MNKNMRRQFLSIFILMLIILHPIAVYGFTSAEAKQLWYDTKDASREAQQAHREAQIAWAADRTEEKNQRVIDTGKDSLLAALDEVEAWLIWRAAEIDENPEIPNELRNIIQEDIESNLAKIEDLRVEVNEVENRIQLAIVFFKMVGKYLELVTDVARNTGLVCVHVANTYADTIEEYENQIREAAGTISDNEDILKKLDEAKAALVEAKLNIDKAESEYLEVLLPGSPLFRFSNGNQHLRLAKNHMIEAQRSLREAYLLLVGE